MLAETDAALGEGSSCMDMEKRAGPLNPEAPAPIRQNRKSRWGERLVHSVSKARNDEGNNITTVFHEDDLSLKRYKEFRRGRSSSTCRYNRPTFQQTHLEEWRCIVCYLWNARGKASCSRCGSAEGVDKVGNFARHSELGASRSRSINRSSMPRAVTNEFRWPPVFETSGSDYVFDPRSNMFYEPKSDFFYDCNSKLYYSNKRKAYFRLTDAAIPVFEPLSASFSDGSLPVKTSSPSKSPEGSKKPNIQIHIRSKELSKSKSRARSQSRGKSEEPLDRRLKEQIKNVEKWNNQISLQSAVLRSPGVALSVGSSLPRSVASTTSGTQVMQKVLDMAKDASLALSSRVLKDENNPKASAVLTTSAGQPICVVCRRKFASLEQLRKHEEQSDLHKANLAKRKASEVTPAPQEQPESIQYQDRAKKRRLLHSYAPLVLPGNRPEVRLTERAAVDPEVALGAHNVGNKLFQTLLAKSSVSASANSSTGLAQAIKEDWKRIENMAQPQREAVAVDGKGKGLGYDQ